MKARPFTIVKERSPRRELAPPNNLPSQLASFIGREKEAGLARQLLQRVDVRLLTLTGPGGVGKTSLALHVAQDLMWEMAPLPGNPSFEDGVYLVRLAPISDPDLVLPTIALTLGLKESGDSPASDSLRDYLRDKRMLLLLDNFEQVLEAAPRVTELMEGCPDLKVLVTSRASLHVRGEHEMAVPPLALPDESHSSNLEELSQYAAVALFIKRAAAIKLDFALTTGNAEQVVEICARLDGLPLAIELAAAHIKLLPPQAMLSRLQKRLPLLVGGARDLPNRHKTIRATMEWSYGLLDDDEKRLFRYASVFVGGFTIEAIEVVAGPWSSSTTTLEGVEALTDKSLLSVSDETQESNQLGQPNGESRLFLLETVREYGLEQLVANAEADDLHRRHLDYYLDLAERLEPDLAGPQQGELMDLLEREHNNLRSAIDWATARKETPLSLRLCCALWWFWRVRGHISNGRRRLEEALSLPQTDRSPQAKLVRASALNAAGVLAYEQGDYPHAAKLHEGSLELGRKLRRKGAIAASLNNLGLVARGHGDFDMARRFYEESLAIRREQGDRWSVSICLNNLGVIAFEQGRYAEARAMHEESLALKRELEDKRGIAIALNNLGSVTSYLGDYDLALALQEESLALHREVSNEWGAAAALAGLGEVALRRGEVAHARALYVESLTLRQKLGDKEGLAESLEGLAGVAALGTSAGHAEAAARLFGAAEAQRNALGAPLPPSAMPFHDRMAASVSALLGERSFVSAWSQGRAMPPEKAKALVTSLDLPAQMDTAVREASPATQQPQALPATDRLAPLLPATPSTTSPSLTQDEFAAATLDLLRNYSRLGMLDNNPLLRTRMVSERVGSKSRTAQRVTALRALVKEAHEALQQSPLDAKLARVIYHTYIQPAPTQEQAAELLDLPFSTYRRHLGKGIARITGILWQWELQTTLA